MRSLLKHQQTSWARSCGLAVDDAGYTYRPEENLPWLTPRTRADFEAADGDEFGATRKRAKIAALHSSSALAVNVFDYWTTRNAAPLAAALNLPYPIEDIRFERKFPTGVGSRAPNLDVVVTGPDRQLLAVESKFCEPFSFRPKPIQDKYFPPGEGRWHAAGLPGAQAAADSLRHESPFKLLDAVQLLKHMLGLAQTRSEWKLLLLWFAPTSEALRAMDAEASRFRQILGSDGARFTWQTYQELWSRLAPRLSPRDDEYAWYLEQRYFRPSVV